MKNVRSLDYPNIKVGMIFRGESLFHLSHKDKKLFLETYHLKTVIDLRTDQEHKDKKNTILPGVKYIHIPLITMEEMGTDSEENGKKKVAKSQQLPDIFDYYRKMVHIDKKEKWKEIFNVLLAEEAPLYFHCTVGKDRSGMVIAVILSALGIDKKYIYQDYLLTNEHPIIPFKYKLFALSLKKDVRKAFWEYFKANKEYLDAGFEYINQTYGNMDNFLKEVCSMDRERINLLKNKYLSQNYRNN